MKRFIHVENYKLMLIVMIGAALVILTGTSYALLKSTSQGTNTYTMNVGVLEVLFQDNNTSSLTLSNMYPMTDTEGLEQNNVLNFTIENTGDFAATYKVYLEETTNLNQNPSFSNVIRYTVSKNDGAYGEVKTLSDNPNIDINASLNRGETANYKVKVWLAEDADNTYMDKTFTAKVVVEVSQDNSLSNKIAAIMKNGGSSYIKSYRATVIENANAPHPTFTTQDKYDALTPAKDVYYFTGADAVTYGNLLFAGYCWQIVRTTDTGGLKLIYNGVAEDNMCKTNRTPKIGINGSAGYQSITISNTTSVFGTGFTYQYNDTTDKYEFTLTGVKTGKSWSSDYTTLLGNYTCLETNQTCETLYYLGSYKNTTSAYGASYTIGNSASYNQIGVSAFNGDYESMAYVGYMYNKAYKYAGNSAKSNGVYSNSIEYINANGVYVLDESDTSTAPDESHHYVCDASGVNNNCAKVRYYYYNNYYMLLENGQYIENLLYDMINYKGGKTSSYNDANINVYNSAIKAYLESWYAQNLEDYSSYIDNSAVYCNDRSISSLGNWSETSASKTATLNFYQYTVNLDLSCKNITDRFSVENEKAGLSKPIGLITEPERGLMGTNYAASGQIYWGLSPNNVRYTGNARVHSVTASGATYYNNSYYAYGARPSVSLRPDAVIVDGSGTVDNPYVVGPKDIVRTTN